VRKIAGNSTNFRPHLNCCDPDAIHDYSPPAFRWSINVSDIDLVKRPNQPLKLTGAARQVLHDRAPTQAAPAA
jgi:hypothetical protein